MQLPPLGRDHVSLPRQRIKNNFLYALAEIISRLSSCSFLHPSEGQLTQAKEADCSSPHRRTAHALIPFTDFGCQDTLPTEISSSSSLWAALGAALAQGAQGRGGVPIPGGVSQRYLAHAGLWAGQDWPRSTANIDAKHTRSPPSPPKAGLQCLTAHQARQKQQK